MIIQVKKAVAHYNGKRPKGERPMTMTSLASGCEVTIQTLFNLMKESPMKVDVKLLLKISIATGCPISEFVPDLENHIK